MTQVLPGSANSTTPLRSAPDQKPRRFDNIEDFRHLFTKNSNDPTQNPHPPENQVWIPQEFYSNSSGPYLPDRTTTTTTPATVPTPSRLPKLPEELIYPTYKYSTSTASANGTSTSPKARNPYITVYPPGFGPETSVDTVTTVDLTRADFAKKWLEEVTATTETEKLLVPKLGEIFDYDFSMEEFPLPVRRHRKTTPRTRSTNHKQLKNKTQKQQIQPFGRQRVTTRKQLKINTHGLQTGFIGRQRVTTQKQFKINTQKHQTRSIGRQGVTVASLTKKRISGSEVKSFWHNPPEIPSSHSQAVSKVRLKPDLLLGKVSLSDLKRPVDAGSEKTTPANYGSKIRPVKLRIEDVRNLGKTTPGNYRSKGNLRNVARTTPGSRSKGILRMGVKPKMVNAPYQNLADLLGLRTTAAKYTTQFIRHKIVPFTTTPKASATESTTTTVEIPTTTTNSTSATKSKNKSKKVHRKEHLILFLLELTRLVATKEQEDVHHVVKHADKIIHSFYKNRQLRWLSQPLIDVIKKIEALIKDSDTSDLQKEAADLHQILRQRHQVLSREMNTLIEYADRLYDEEDGRHLREVINEFAVFPNVTLSGYWVCKSLMINFLRPYRRLKDHQLQQHLISSVKTAQQKVFAPGANMTSTQKDGDGRFETTTPEDSEVRFETTMKEYSKDTPGTIEQEDSEVTPETNIQEDSDARLDTTIKKHIEVEPGTTVMGDSDDRDETSTQESNEVTSDTTIKEDSETGLETTKQESSKVTSEHMLTNVTVDTPVGKIRGLSGQNYTSFLGIPYGVVDETNPFGNAQPPPYFNTPHEAYEDIDVLRCPQYDKGVISGTIQCLRLNVYVPNKMDTQNTLLVMVYIHGGAFVEGNGGKKSYSPIFLVKHDVILVAINYRLGPYGNLCLPNTEYSNQAFKDQNLALKWVKNNIRSFGGNTDNIVFFGHSSGSVSVNFHLLYDEDILFNKVILQSGSAVSSFLNEATSMATFVKDVGLDGENIDVERFIQTVSAIDTNTVINITKFYNFRPCIDGEYITKSPKMRNLQNMKLMIGGTSKEMLYFYPTEDRYEKIDFVAELEKGVSISNMADRTEAIDTVKHFYLDNLKVNIIDFVSDLAFNYPIERTVRYYVQNKCTVYRYLFTYDGHRNYMKIRDNINAVGSTHGDELGYLFDMPLLEALGDITVEDQVIIDRMSLMWTNFAKYGDPTPDTSKLLPVKWTPVTAGAKSYLQIDTNMGLFSGPFQNRMAFWDSYYEKYRKFVKGIRLGEKRNRKQMQTLTNGITRIKTTPKAVEPFGENIGEDFGVIHKNLHNAHNFIARVDDGQENLQPAFRTTQVETFTDFIQETVNILNTLNATVFKDFFEILDTEIRKYHYEDCRFSELMQNHNTRTLLADALKTVRENSVTFTKVNINEIADMLREEIMNRARTTTVKLTTRKPMTKTTPRYRSKHVSLNSKKKIKKLTTKHNPHDRIKDMFSQFHDTKSRWIQEPKHIPIARQQSVKQQRAAVTTVATRSPYDALIKVQQSNRNKLISLKNHMRVGITTKEDTKGTAQSKSLIDRLYLPINVRSKTQDQLPHVAKPSIDAKKNIKPYLNKTFNEYVKKKISTFENELKKLKQTAYLRTGETDNETEKVDDRTVTDNDREHFRADTREKHMEPDDLMKNYYNLIKDHIVINNNRSTNESTTHNTTSTTKAAEKSADKADTDSNVNDTKNIVNYRPYSSAKTFMLDTKDLSKEYVRKETTFFDGSPEATTRTDDDVEGRVYSTGAKEDDEQIIRHKNPYDHVNEMLAGTKMF
ncbi:hypothetical protein PYW07_012853 [Mythimna separata]|uniref:Carboxylesterase type B domain-containing protein n=1 Tax=Mythimna separata TaxID=271217 RepID=A0AAD8DL75_MYTSE|nr:hypothetical protein PYW07_012853 [Mythimna separata]